MTVLVFSAAIIALAAGRVSYCVANEEIFRRMRELVFRYSSPRFATNSNGEPWRMLHWYKSTNEERKRGHKKILYEFDPNLLREPGFFGQLVECPYCLSFWMTLIMILLYNVAPIVVAVIALWALSSLVVRLMP
jgi:hypothetical protein